MASGVTNLFSGQPKEGDPGSPKVERRETGLSFVPEHIKKEKSNNKNVQPFAFFCACPAEVLLALCKVPMVITLVAVIEIHFRDDMTELHNLQSNIT